MKYSDNSQKMGSDAESRFVDTMRKNGHAVEKSNVKQDMKEHWDYLIDGKHKVEVKARKKRKRHDDSPDDDIIYVEFLNVRGDMGWLYGKADYVAFERVDGFLLVPLKLLADLSENLVSSMFTNYPTLYKSYRRRDRPYEHVGLIRYEDLLALPNKLVK